MERSAETEGEAIAQAASAWHARISDPGAGSADRHAFRRWRAADPRHDAAFAEAAALWAAIGPAAAALGRDGWYRERPQAVRRPWLLGAAIGAAAAALLVVGVTLWRDPGLADRALADMATTPGRPQAAMLADGSRLELDADSAVDIDLGGPVREIRLRRGRLFIDVARDESRPFRVLAGEAMVEVLGTAFSVARLDDGLAAVVDRGVISVSRGGARVTLRAGEAADAASGRALASRPASAVAFAWRQGLLVFDRTPLSDVIAALEQSGAGRIVLTDTGTATATFSGVFQADRPEAVLAALRPALGLEFTRVPGIGTLVHR